MSRRYWGNEVLGPITKVTYVIRMNQHKMGREAKRMWLSKLRKACQETITKIDLELSRMNREDWNKNA